MICDRLMPSGGAVDLGQHLVCEQGTLALAVSRGACQTRRWTASAPGADDFESFCCLRTMAHNPRLSWVFDQAR